MTPEILRREIGIYVSMHPDGCCMGRVINEGKSGSDHVLDAMSAAKSREHPVCIAMAMMLLSSLPLDRDTAVAMHAQGRDNADT